MEERELFKNLINKSLQDDDMSVFNFVVGSLISADNNVTEEEIKKNCKSIQILIDVLSNYPENDKLHKNKQQLIQYNNMYLK